jgi:hypothetical protein
MGSTMTVHHSRRPWEEEGGSLSWVNLMSHHRSQSSIDTATTKVGRYNNNNQSLSSITSTPDNNNKIVDNNAGVMITPSLADGTLQGKERLYDMLQTRNITQVDAQYWNTIPKWETIMHNIFQQSTNDENVDTNNNNEYKPIIYGLETCTQFQQSTSTNPTQRRIAPAGMFNTGTNYLSVLLEYNCQNTQRIQSPTFHGNTKRGHGNEWEVPWGKHTPASYRTNYTKNTKKNMKK